MLVEEEAEEEYAEADSSVKEEWIDVDETAEVNNAEIVEAEGIVIAHQ